MKRKVYPIVLPKVEYSFTELGGELQAIFFALESWGSNFMTVTNADGEVMKADASCYTANKI